MDTNEMKNMGENGGLSKVDNRFMSAEWGL